MDKMIKFLKEKITDNSSFEEIIDVFEQMCKIQLEEDMILFETGTFTSFSDVPMFQISLVRQFPNEDEIHVDVLYKSDDENKMLSESVWDEDLDEDIFAYIRKSKAFAYAKNKNYSKVKIWCEET